MIDEFIAKVLELFSRVSNLKMILMSIILAFAYLLYITSDSISSYVHFKVENATRVEYYIPKESKVSKQNITNINQTLTRYIDNDKNIGIIAVYQFIPAQDTFYQGRILVTSVVQKNSNYDVSKYNIQWLPISALSAQTRLLLQGKVFYAELKKLINDYLNPDNDQRDEYLTPANFNAMYQDGVRYVVSVPVSSTRIVGYVTVCFNKIPDNPKEQQEFISIAKDVANNAGYYISF